MGNQLDDGFSPSKLSLLTVNARCWIGSGRYNRAATGQNSPPLTQFNIG
jgi:hypothetical protein